MIGTGITTANATVKAVRILDEEKENKGEDLTVIEKIKIAAPIYLTPAIFGTSTITCILGANLLNKRMQTTLVSAYGVLAQSYRAYQDKVIDIYSKEANEKIKEEIVKEQCPRRRCATVIL